MDAVAIECPVCKTPTTSLKSARYFYRLVFLGVAAVHRMEQRVCCPSCLRRRLLARTFANVLTANIMWPLTVVPVHLWHGLASFLPGHSRRVREWMEESPSFPATR